MNLRKTIAAVALSLAVSSAGSGCAALYHGGNREQAEAEPDSGSIRLLVANQNDEAVRLILTRGVETGWIGTVSPMTTQAIRLPADIPGGGGAFSIRVLTISGQEWDARGIVPRGGSTLRLDIDRNIRASTWTMK